jgi:hypothetical protein
MTPDIVYDQMIGAGCAAKLKRTAPEVEVSAPPSAAELRALRALQGRS